MQLFYMCLRTLVVLLVLNFSIFSQNPPNRTNTDRRSRADVVRDNLEQRMVNMRNNRIRSNRRGVNSRKRRSAIIRPKLSDELKQQLKIDDNTKELYSSILNQENTGVFKLFPFKNCSVEKKKKKRFRCWQENANIRGFANGFSFRQNEHSILAKSDISIKKDVLVTGKHSVQTIITDLGDVSLDDLSKDSAGVSYLASFKPSVESKEMDKEYNMFLSGLVAGTYANGGIVNPHSFSKASKIIINHTYAIRSIAYRPENSVALEKDKDVIIVFRVIDNDAAGGVVILWKQLEVKEGLVMKYADTQKIEVL